MVCCRASIALDVCLRWWLQQARFQRRPPHLVGATNAFRTTWHEAVIDCELATAALASLEKMMARGLLTLAVLEDSDVREQVGLLGDECDSTSPVGEQAKRVRAAWSVLG